MQRTVIPPRRWVPVDLWLMANRAQRDALYGQPRTTAEVERLVDAQRAAARRRGQSS